MGMMQNVLNISLKWFCGHLSRSSPCRGKSDTWFGSKSPKDKEVFTGKRTQILRVVPEPVQSPAGMVGQNRPWTCHSELVILDALMQHQF